MWSVIWRKTLIDEARAENDMIIVDTPPVLVVPDARIIADQADAIIFSVQWDKTSKTQVEEALRMFHNSGQRITGLVLSRISPRGMKRYGYADTSGAIPNTARNITRTEKARDKAQWAFVSRW